MKLRLGLTAVLAVVLLVPAASTAVALPSSPGNENATASQYPVNQQGVPIQSVQGGQQGQAVRSVARQDDGSGSLAFTGYAAIPVLLIGAGLLLVGIMTRRRFRTEPGTA